ncbi:hypothetical protein A6R68_19799 [Neotoma lepida]|uniref:DPH-type MB domain-containing protein n=1 Tax=Neotoma lepida TaxID=56216 RepID=A0A1A6HGX3_NEOLE|nr:hypothetical protein A6R68_19799 [Neotoma lepida]
MDQESDLICKFSPHKRLAFYSLSMIDSLRRKSGELIHFAVPAEDLENGEDVATCPSCSLIIKVIYDKQCQMANGGLMLRAKPLNRETHTRITALVAEYRARPWA